MEHTLYISALDQLHYFYARPFERLYFGAEFCPWLLPTPDQVDQALDFCQREDIAFSLVTGLITEPHLDRARKLLDGLPRRTEVVLGDWGLLADVRQRGLTPVAGRMLIKVKRDPRVVAADLADPELAQYLRSSNLSQPGFGALLADHDIARAELDNVPQGYDLALPSGLRTSLYYPYVYLSVTRRCAGRNPEPGGLDGGACRQGCGQTLIQARMPPEGGASREGSYFIQGPLLFFKHEKQPADTAGWNLDRLVFQPVPPVKATDPDVAAFGDWDDVYARRGAAVQWGYDQPDETLVRLARQAARERDVDLPQPLVLDLGCGNGRNGLALNASFPVLGLDRSGNALARFHERDPEVPLLLGDATRLPLVAGSVDGIVDSGCFHALPPARWAAYVREVRRVVRPGGWLLLVVRQRAVDQPAGRPLFWAETVLPEWGFTPDDLRARFEPALRLHTLEAHQGRDDESFYYALFGKER
jgi:SAM-dependent methyltransferase